MQVAVCCDPVDVWSLRSEQVQLNYLNSPFYAFSSVVRNLGLNPIGEDTGTAEVLSRVIIERKLL